MRHGIHVVDATMFWSATGGGVGRYLRAKHDWLAGRPGWRHTIAVPTPPDDSAAEGIARLPSIALPGSGGYRLPLRRGAVARVLAGLQPDLIEAGDPYRVAWSALDAARQGGVPAVAYCHSNLVAMARLVAGPLLGAAAETEARRYARHLYRRFDLVLAPSAAMASHLRDWGVERVATAPLGVDSAVFHPRRADARWRQALGFDAGTRVLVYAGRFAREKHLGLLAEAVARLGAPYALVAIGAGPAPPPPGDRVIVLPFARGAEAVATALASADLFVHAGDQETFGLSVLEALACGTPAVVRAADGLAQWADGHACLGVEVPGATTFAEAIAAAFEGDRQARRRAARAHAAGHDWADAFAGLIDHYGRVLGVAGAPNTPPNTAPAVGPPAGAGLGR
ncbi:MAG: glycosyltransferase [Caldimonas sp.]